MAIFTKADDLFELFGQSVGGNPIEGGNVGYETKRFFQPEAGLDVIVKNPTFLDTDEDEYPTGVFNYNDRRRILGTTTLNNRDWWENSNYDENSFQPYLTDNKKIVFNQQVVIDGNYDEIVVNEDREKSSFFKFSIDAIPFVINPNTNEIVRLDRYHDKKIDSEKYTLATEGKINYYILPRTEGRTPAGNIDTFKSKGKKRDGGENVFDRYADDINSDSGYHLFRLDWGDETPLEHITETKVLESSTLLEHIYEKPGYYTITGVVMAFDGSTIGSWEKFETNILINPSLNYDVDLYDYENFATIGGISSDSVLVKSATDLIGINPITFDVKESPTKLVKNINLFDRLNIYNFLTKIDHTILNKYNSDFEDYTKEIFDEPGPMMIDGEIIGCLDPQSSNYDPNAERDLTEGSICDYNLQLIATAPITATNYTITFYFVNNEGNMLSYAPEDEPFYTTVGMPFYGEVGTPPGNFNPYMTPARRSKYISEVGESWIDYDKIDNASTKKTIQTNPTNSSQRTTVITKSELLNAQRILIGIKAPGSGAHTDTVTFDDFGFNIEPVPHSTEEAQALGRNSPNLTSDIVNNVYDNVTSQVNETTVNYNQYRWWITPSNGEDSYFRAGYYFNTTGTSGNPNDWEIEKEDMSFLELNIDELQDAGATADGGLNGAYNINFSFTTHGGDGGGNGHIPGGDGP